MCARDVYGSAMTFMRIVQFVHRVGAARRAALSPSLAIYQRGQINRARDTHGVAQSIVSSGVVSCAAALGSVCCNRGSSVPRHSYISCVHGERFVSRKVPKPQSPNIQRWRAFGTKHGHLALHDGSEIAR